MKTDSSHVETHAPSAPPKRKRWVLRIALAVVAALVLVVALAPTIMSLDVFCRYAMTMAGERLAATMSAQSWHLAWFGPQEVSGLSVQLADGQKVIGAARVKLDQGLIGLWRAPKRLGPVQIEQAAVWTEGIAAWKEALARQAAKEAPPPTPPAEEPPPLPQAVRIDSLAVHTSAGALQFGQIALADVPDKEGVQRFDATYSDGRGKAAVTASIHGLRTDWRGYEAVEVTGRMTMTELALRGLLGIAKDLGVSVDGGGTLSGYADFSRTRTGDVTVRGDLSGTGVSITGSFLNGDRPAIDKFRLSGNFSRTGSKYEITDLQLADSPVDAKASATFTLSPGGIPTGAGAATINVNLKWLAEALPKTLQVQKGLTMESGSLLATVDMQSAQGGQPELRVAADVKDLRGRREGKLIALQPFHVAFDVLQDRPAATEPAAAKQEPSLFSALEVKSLVLTGGFGSVKAKGRLEDFTLDAQLDLARATAEAVQFVDLKGYGGAGNLTLHVVSRGNPAGKIALAADASLEKVQVDFGGGRRWQEPQATLTAKAALTFNDKRELMAASVERVLFDGHTAYLDTKGSLSRESGPWEVAADIEANGQGARLLALASLALAVSGSSAQADAADWRRAVSDLAHRNVAGDWGLVGKAKGSLAGDLKFALRAEFKDLVVPCGPERSWQEPSAAIDARGALRFSQEQEFAAASVDSATVKTSTLALAAKGSAEQAAKAWTFGGGASLDGSVAGLAGLANLALNLAQAAEPPKPGAAMAKDPRDRAIQIAAQLAAADGQVHLRGNVSGTSDKFIGVKGLEVNLRSISAPALADITTKPLKADEVKVAGDLRYDFAGGGQLTAQNLAIAVPGFSGTVTATADLGKLGTDQFQATADLARVSVNLGQLSAVLAPFGLLPAEPTLAGVFALEKLSASAQPGGITSVAFDGRGENVDIRWADGRRISEPALAASAEANLTHDADWHFTQITVSRASARLPAGTVSGTVAGQASPKGWTWTAKAGGQGDAKQLAQTVARILNREAGPVEGKWQVQASYKRSADAANDIDLAASVAGLTVPPTSKAGATGAAEANIPLGDVSVVLAALVSGDRIEIRRADLAGGGVRASAKGAVRLPAAEGTAFAADGTLRIDEADLATLEKTLKPFGIIPAAWSLGGKAKLAGTVTTDAGKVAASGTLDVTGLNLDLGEEQIRVAESSVHLKAAFAHEPKERRWEFAAEEIESALVRGSARGAVVLAPETKRPAADEPDTRAAAAPRPPSRLEAQWDLACDAQRLRSLLGKHVPTELAMSGALKAGGRVAGTLASEGPWNQRIAGLVGSGNLEIAQVRYEKLTCGSGVIRWGINQGQMLLANDPAQPSRLTVAGGTAALGGWIDLRGPVARLYMAPTSRLVFENVRLSDPGVSQYLRFTTPILAGSVNENGRVSGEVAALDFPLDADGVKKATANMRFTIYEFQTELQGGLAILIGWYGQPTKTPVQTLGPIDVQLAGGTFRIKEHAVVFGPDTSVLFKGDISVEKQLNIEISMPLTAAMLKRFGVADSAAPYLVNQRMSLPLTGTTDKPHLDDKLAAKRIGQLVAEAAKRAILRGIGDMLKKELK